VFRRDVGGVAAVEFGLIAPVLMIMMLGAFEITRAVSIDRRFSVVTSMIADLVAREQELKAADVTAIYEIAKLVMAPYDTSKLKISLIPVASDPNNASKTLVYPAITNRPNQPLGGELARCTAYTLPAGLVEKNESVIVVESSYEFAPMFATIMKPGKPWTDRAIAKPRKASCVDFDGNSKPCGTCF
jgi:Flp pilus assembly protein TadG